MQESSWFSCALGKYLYYTLSLRSANLHPKAIMERNYSVTETTPVFIENHQAHIALNDYAFWWKKGH